MAEGTLGSPSFSFCDIPAACFPVTFRALRADTRECVWSETVEGPGALQVPPLARIHGAAVIIEVVSPCGREMYWPPCTCGHEHSLHEGDPYDKGACPDCPCQGYEPGAVTE